MVAKYHTEEDKLQHSMRWLIDNYGHIWWNKDLSVEHKAGFLAACCDPRRCYLATMGLKQRIDVIEKTLMETLFS